MLGNEGREKVISCFSSVIKRIIDNVPGAKNIFDVVKYELGVSSLDELSSILINDPISFYEALRVATNSQLIANNFMYFIMKYFSQVNNVHVSARRIFRILHRGSVKMWNELINEIIEKINK